MDRRDGSRAVLSRTDLGRQSLQVVNTDPGFGGDHLAIKKLHPDTQGYPDQK